MYMVHIQVHVIELFCKNVCHKISKLKCYPLGLPLHLDDLTKWLVQKLIQSRIKFEICRLLHRGNFTI